MSDDQDNNVVTLADYVPDGKPDSSNSLIKLRANHLRFGNDRVCDINGKLLFEVDKDGVKALIEKLDAKTKRIYVIPLHICGPLRIHSEGRTPDHDGWTKFFHLINGDGEIVEVAIPTETLSGDGAKLREILMGHGLYVAAEKKQREMLLDYVVRCRSDARIILVQRMGWY